MQDPIDPAARTRVFWLRIAALGGVIVVLVALAPALLTALRAGVSLLALGAVLAIAWASLQALPYFGQKLEKRLLRARLADAQAHPIDELLRQLLERSAQLERYRAALSAIAAQIEDMRDMLEARRAAEPKHDTTKQASALQKMVTFHAHHVQKLAAAEVALADYERHLATKHFEWGFAQAGKRVLENLRTGDREDILRELLSDEASRSVQWNFNRIFSTLDSELRHVQELDAHSLRQLEKLP